ncbi:MAG: hypothetical protein AB7O04_08600, partial [Hyphomonadaceae bacterium]
AFAAGATIASLAIDGGAIYIGGAVKADALNGGAAARAALAGMEGFVARISTDLGATALDRTTYLGSSKDDAIGEVAVVNGIVYAAGTSKGVLAGLAPKGAADGFLARLDDGGDIAWLRNFTASGNTLNVTSLAVDQTGASALDRLGLPKGRVATTDSTRLVDRSSLRAGDEFTLSINGGLPKRITIAKTDTLSLVAQRIDQTLGSQGDAIVVRDGDVERIEIKMRRGASALIEHGRDGRDALGGLGLKAGLVAIKPTPDAPAQRGEIRSFGLGIAEGDLNLEGAAALKRTKAEISAAMSILQQAYDALANPASLDKTDEEREREQRMAAAAPEYYSNQLANYAAALSYLSGLNGSS